MAQGWALLARLYILNLIGCRAVNEDVWFFKWLVHISTVEEYCTIREKPHSSRLVMIYNLRGLLHSILCSFTSQSRRKPVFGACFHSLTGCPDRWPFYLTSWHERCNLLLYEFWVTLPRRQDMPKYSSMWCDRSGGDLLIRRKDSSIKPSSRSA